MLLPCFDAIWCACFDDCMFAPWTCARQVTFAHACVVNDTSEWQIEYPFLVHWAMLWLLLFVVAAQIWCTNFAAVVQDCANQTSHPMPPQTSH